MLFGRHDCKISKSGELELPDLLRKNIPSHVYLTCGIEECVFLLPPASFEMLYRKISANNTADINARMLRRLIIGSAHMTEIVRSNILSVPEGLLKHAGVDESAVLIGQGEYLEIWGVAQWSRQSEMLFDHEINSTRFIGLDLSFENLSR